MHKLYAFFTGSQSLAIILKGVMSKESNANKNTEVVLM